MTTTSPTWLALDVGGANLKASHSSGKARSVPFELWKRPDELALVTAQLIHTLPPADRIALTMTAELCDCYATKTVGVHAVIDAVVEAVAGLPVSIWGTDGRFHPVTEVQANPLIAAASNWLALATVVARLIPDGPGILIDIGSTTSDLIGLADGQVRGQGRTDTERLQTGELVYLGVRRTPLCALTTELPFRGRPTGLMAEFFASTLDIYLTLGEIASDPKDLSTADGRPSTADAAVDRLARMVGADRDGFTSEDSTAFAQGADEVVLGRLETAIRKVCADPPRHAVVAGSGEFLARRLARRILPTGGTILSLGEVWGPLGSSAACAHALVVLAQEAGDLE